MKSSGNWQSRKRDRIHPDGIGGLVFPGCLPDGEPNGPFKNDETAERAAEQGAYHEDDIDWELTRN